jgi:hypothetical protein
MLKKIVNFCIKKVLEINLALPCRSIEQEIQGDYTDRHYNVELDPASEVETRELVGQANLSIVGWYHSHPTFAPNPRYISITSVTDLFNQRSYQNLFRTNLEHDTNTIEPFVGAIVCNLKT